MKGKVKCPRLTARWCCAQPRFKAENRWKITTDEVTNGNVRWLRPLSMLIGLAPSIRLCWPSHRRSVVLLEAAMLSSVSTSCTPFGPVGKMERWKDNCGVYVEVYNMFFLCWMFLW